MERIAIALVNHEVQIGGAEVALLRLAEGLVGRFGLRALLPREGPLADELRAGGVPVEVIPMPAESLSACRGSSLGLVATLAGDTFSWPGALRALASRVRGVDLVLTGSTKAHVYGGLAARVAGRPLIWWLHDTVDGTTFGPAARFIVRNAARTLPHRIVAVSRAAASSLRFPPGDPRVRVVYNGVRRPPRLEPGETAGGAPRVGWIGRLVPSKGPDMFLEVAARVLARVPVAQFALAGSEDARAQEFAAGLRERAEALGVAGRVDFLGRREDPWSMLDTLSVLAFTSLASDSLPNVLLEAMVSGVPVVAFSGGGVGEIVEDGRTGYTVPRGRVDLMAERVAVLLEGHEAREAFRDRARARARELFGWERWTAEWEREILDLMGVRPQP